MTKRADISPESRSWCATHGFVAPEIDIRLQTEGCIQNLRAALEREGLYPLLAVELKAIATLE